MFKYIPIHPQDHDALVGKDFNAKFATEMSEYYMPFAKKQRDIQIAKETWEYAVADSIPGASWVGAGKNVVDVRAPMCDIDVKGLSSGHINGITTEASFLQNNKKENDNFNKLFESADYLALKQMFVDPLVTKVKDTSNLHLMAIVRDKTAKKVYYALFKMDNSPLTQEEFLAGMHMDAGRSVSIPMIDPQYGKTYIYIPKRRLEIRFDCSGLKDYLVYSHSY